MEEDFGDDFGIRNIRRWLRLKGFQGKSRISRTRKRKSRRLRMATKVKHNAWIETITSIRITIERLTTLCTNLLHEMPLHVDTHCIGNVPDLPPTVISLLSK